MLRNYIKIGLRNLRKQKAYSVINIMGLAVGFASSMLIMLWIKHEVSYDRFHEKRDQVFRITCHLNEFKAAICPPALPDAIAEQFPEVKSKILTSMEETHLMTVHDKAFEESLFFVDSNFLETFSFPLRHGDPAEVLKRPESILLTAAMATKYFANENPIGKSIKLDNDELIMVTGVLEDIPATSHLQFDFLMPMSYKARTDRDLQDNVWDNFNFYAYLELDYQYPTSPESMRSLEDKIDRLYADNVEELTVNFRLQPITEIHLQSDFLGDVSGHGNIQYVYIMSIIALLILVIASINFMNLATARSSRRAREVGFRKVAGAKRRQLILQFLTESCVISFLSLILAIGLVLLLIPAFETITGKEMSAAIMDLRVIPTLAGLALFIGLLAGSYPALYLSKFNPASVFSIHHRQQGGHGIFRNALVLTQFVFSIVLIIGTIVIYRQQQFIRNQNLGYDKENLVYIHLRGDLIEKKDAFKTRLENTPFTDQYTFLDGLPTNLLSGTVSLDWEGKNPEEQFLFAQLDADQHFIDVFDMKMRSGRPFSEDFGTDEYAYLLNEKAVEVMGKTPDEVVGSPFTLWTMEGTVVGVVEDFHFKPIQQPIEPLVMRFNDRGNYAVVRTSLAETESTLRELEKISQELNPAYPFEYGFIDQDLANLYDSEQRLGNLSNIFAIIAIFISCLGLYGLSAYLAEQRKKEIGVRKVVGASVAQVVYMLSRDFTKPIWISMLVAIPLAFVAANRWLDNFAYHIELSWLTVIFSCIIAWFIAIATISFETIRAATSNPIDALQQE